MRGFSSEPASLRTDVVPAFRKVAAATCHARAAYGYQPAPFNRARIIPPEQPPSRGRVPHVPLHGLPHRDDRLPRLLASDQTAHLEQFVLACGAMSRDRLRVPGLFLTASTLTIFTGWPFGLNTNPQQEVSRNAKTNRNPARS